jgi:thioredoxin reductase (NADPH)
MLDVAIIGGGPAGLATAIECGRKGLSHTVLEKGALVDSIRRFPINMVYFTTPELLEIGELPLTCAAEKPTRLESLKYYRRVAAHYEIPLRLYERVRAVGPVTGGFELETSYELGQPGTPPPVRARRLVVACGYYDNPNPLGVPGEDLPKVSHYFTESHPYFGLDVAIVGGANSAAESALELFRSGVSVTLIHRGRALSTHIKYWVRPDILNRIERGEVKAFFETEVVAIRPGIIELRRRTGEAFEIANHAVLALTGYHPDYAFLSSMGIEIDSESGKPRVDPDTCETNVPGIYLAGGIVAGRETNKIFIENGRFHGKKIVEHLAAS